MPKIEESTVIQGLFTMEPDVYGDERGRFMETFRREWFPQRSWERVQMNRSESIQNVVRGLHYHYHQVDYWFVMAGMIRAALVDIRPNSPTFKQTLTVDMGDDNRIGLFIPVGVAHGFNTLSERVLLTYVVDNYYDKSDEFGIAWDDPDLAIDWGIPHSQAIISQRDATNPRLKEADLSHYAANLV
ncbi:MAG: dTDP-4-dehydrorhamnose 3,5-epimerase [Chloroflexota bacterium]